MKCGKLAMVAFVLLCGVCVCSLEASTGRPAYKSPSRNGGKKEVVAYQEVRVGRLTVQGNNVLYTNDLLGYQVLYPNDWDIEERINIIGEKALTHGETKLSERSGRYEIIVYASQLGDEGYEWGDGWSFSSEAIVINGTSRSKSIIRDSQGKIARFFVRNLGDAVTRRWIEVNFLVPPKKRDLKKVDRFLKTYRPS